MRGRVTEHGLFVDVRGGAGDPPLLFLHGGPGQGAYEFMAVQGEHLGRMVALTGLDQRGVGRSAPLPPGAPLTETGLVDDCELVRQALGIERWAVLGQSFGGRLALRYATSHPESVTAVIFENPVWDLALSFLAALPRLAAMLAERGQDAQAQAALAAVKPEQPAQPLLAAYRTALEDLGADRETFFVPSLGTRARLRDIRQAQASTGPGGDTFDGESSERHHLAIAADLASHRSLLPLLAMLTVPALLITGGQDPLTSEEQRLAFRLAFAPHAEREFPGAGHYVYADDPPGYASAVAGFLLDQASSAAVDLQP